MLSPEAQAHAASAREATAGHRVRFKPSAYARDFDIVPGTEGTAGASYDWRNGRATNVHLDDGRFCTGVPMSALEVMKPHSTE